MKNAALAKWKRDVVTFVEEVLIDPETGKPFELYEEEKTFLCSALTLTPAGRLAFPKMVFSAPKKSGKTALAAMVRNHPDELPSWTRRSDIRSAVAFLLARLPSSRHGGRHELQCFARRLQTKVWSAPKSAPVCAEAICRSVVS
jgi:hypothetical protein